MIRKFLALLILTPSLCSAVSVCTVEKIEPGTPAETSGLKPGDQILDVGGKPLTSFDELLDAIRKSADTLPLGVQRGDEKIQIPVKMPPSLRPRLGVECAVPAHEHRNRIALGDQKSLSLYGGVALPQWTLDAQSVGAGDERVGAAGSVFGLRFLNDINPRMDLGIDFGTTALGDHSFAISGRAIGDTEIDMRSLLLMAVFKFHPPRPGRVLPYGLIGAGVHRSTLDWRFHPAAGSPVTGSGSLVQDTAINYALAVAGGTDIDLDERWFIGLEARGNYLGSSTYHATPLGVEAAINSVTTAQFTFNFLAHLGYRFGPPPLVPLQLP